MNLFKRALCLMLVLLAMGSLCACSGNSNPTKAPSDTSNLDNKFVGTWKCDSWVPAFGSTENNAKMILKADGTGTYQPGETWAILPATWEKVDDKTIIVYADTTGSGSVSGTEYCYEIIDGIPHLKFDNGIVTKNFYKQ